MKTPPTLVAATLLLVGACAPETGVIAASDDAGLVVVADDLFYEPDRIEVIAGVPTTVRLHNDGGIVHDLVLESGWESGQVRPGERITVEMEPLTASTVAWCSIPGHRSAGMELDVIVTDPPA